MNVNEFSTEVLNWGHYFYFSIDLETGLPFYIVTRAVQTSGGPEALRMAHRIGLENNRYP